jgi:hypothetical protein
MMGNPFSTRIFAIALWAFLRYDQVPFFLATQMSHFFSTWAVNPAAHVSSK